MVVRTPGRRYWETHWHIRLAGFIAILCLSVSVWFTYSRVQELRGPESPHYKMNSCFACHESQGSHMTAADCFECHDLRSRALLPGAVEKREKISGVTPCAHPIKNISRNGGRTVTRLCLSCHKVVSGYVAMVHINSKKYIEIDMALTHPIGLMPTEGVYPRTLPLSHETGAIDCITCHDQHAMDRRMKTLRYYYPGNGHPADFRPLCNDCHADGWMPLRLRVPKTD